MGALAGVDVGDPQRLTAGWAQAADAGDRDGAIIPAQRQIPDKGSEISEPATLATELNLTGTVVTADAPHTQRTTGRTPRVEDAASHPPSPDASTSAPSPPKRLGLKHDGFLDDLPGAAPRSFSRTGASARCHVRVNRLAYISNGRYD